MKKITFLFFPILLITISCEKNCELPTQIIGTGEIISNASVSHPLTTLEMTNNGHVIRTQEENVFDLKVKFEGDSIFDAIDFTQYTLLGKYASGGCRVVFERNVTRNDSQKNVLYDITVHQCGDCQIYHGEMNWVLIPKIPDDYTVTFVVEYNVPQN